MPRDSHRRAEGHGLDYLSPRKSSFEAEGLDVEVSTGDVPWHRVEPEGLQVPGALAASALHQGEGRGDPGAAPGVRYGTPPTGWASCFRRPDRDLRGDFVAARFSIIREPKDLKDVSDPSSHGRRQLFERALPAGTSTCSWRTSDRQHRRLPPVRRHGSTARSRCVAAPPQIAMARAARLRKIIEGSFEIHRRVPDGFPKETMTAYPGALYAPRRRWTPVS